MIVTNATVTDLQAALVLTNEQFDNNIEFRRLEQIGPSRIRFTLTVGDSRKAGARRSASWANYNRRVKAACWHVHGTFFDNLFLLRPDAVVRAGTRKITATRGNWEDWNIGAPIMPVYYSEACECH